MKAQVLHITNEAEWLEKRKSYVTSTEVAALFGLSPYMTAFELYHIKRGSIDGSIPDNNFMKFGKILEAPICEMIKLEHPSWEISDFPYFYYDDNDGIGSSYDRAVIIDGKKYALEIKSTSYAEYKKNFIEHSDDDIEAPPHYEIQMQTEIELLEGNGFSGCIMAVFILDTRELKYIFRERNKIVCEEMRKAVKSFWEMTEPPAPDYARDKSIISRICPAVNPDVQMDATQNNRVTELAAQYRLSKDLIKQEEANADAASAELLKLLGDARYAWTNSHKITVSDIKPNPGKVVTPEMVGTFIGARSGYKRLTIKSTGEAND